MRTVDKISISGFVIILIVTGILYLADLHRRNGQFIQAIRTGNLPAIKTFVQTDQSLVNQPSPLSSTTPLHEAAASGQNEVILFLLANGAKIDAERDARRTPLHMATFYGHADTVDLLAKHGANINHLAWRHNNTPLQVAVANSHLDVVKTLLNLGADVSIRDMNGETALEEAQERKLTSIIQLLQGRQKPTPNKANSTDAKKPRN